MSRKSLILALAVLFSMLLALGIAIAFLYSDTGSGQKEKTLSLGGACSCLSAVPSDAVLVACSSAADKACAAMLSSFAIPDSIAVAIEDGSLASLRRCPMSVSLHYSGKLIPLYVFDVEDVSETSGRLLEEKLSSLGCFTQTDGSFLLASESETLVKSSSRHLDSGVCIVDAPGFKDAMESVDGRDLLFVPHLHIRRLLAAVGSRDITRHAQFVERSADWSAFVVGRDEDRGISLEGTCLMDGDPDEYLAVFDGCEPSVSEVAKVLPSYVLSFVSVPMKDMEEYVSAYKSFIDTRQHLHTMMARQNELSARAGISPEALFAALDVDEIASASFMVKGKKEKVNLLKIGNRDASLVFKGTGIDTFRGYTPAVHDWAYPSFMSSVFGDIFDLKDESCFTYADGWVVTGSREALDEYVGRKMLDYTLEDYLADVGKPDMFTQAPSLAVAYYSLTEGSPADILKPEAGKIISDVLSSEYVPALLQISESKGRVTASAHIYGLTPKKTKAPAFDRDTTVHIPSGPFKVRNSHTGKINTFYQNSSKAICLRDEKGKDLWGVPFDKALCGTACNVDYFANGKLQILFGAGSSIYLIDRLGRYVGGFPVDLGKEILLGPDVYDFSGSRRYNVMVLHKDNTVDMYNLKGRKPDQWKTITAGETIKALPQRLTLSGKDFWVVRTSIRTLIFPFYGGDPLTVFEGDAMIRPDSEIRVVDAQTVEFDCYDGKMRTLKIK